MAMGDDAYKVFLNAAGDKSGVPEELAGFLDYLSGESPKDPFTKKLDVLLQQAREHKQWEVEYMTLAMQYREKYKEGREEGRAEGILYTLYSLVSDGVISVAEAVKRTNLTPVEFEAGYQEWKNR